MCSIPLLLVMMAAVVVLAKADLKTLPLPDGQGWSLILNRFDNSDSFDRYWDEYKKGFGHPGKGEKGEFYIGNEMLHRITTKSGSTYRFRAEVQFKSNAEWHSIEFSNMTVDSEENDYTLYLSGEVGSVQSCINASGSPLISIKFSTCDRDNDNLPERNCASEFKGGYWFGACNCACLMCDYDNKSLYWYRNGTLVADLSAIRMKIKPNDD